MLRKLLLLILSVYLLPDISAQNTVISGKITEKSTGNPIPYANIVFTGTYIGTTSDVNGDYNLTTAKPAKTLEVSAIGYIKQVVPVKIGEINNIDFALEEEVFSIGEIKVTPGANPA